MYIVIIYMKNNSYRLLVMTSYMLSSKLIRLVKNSPNYCVYKILAGNNW